MVWEGLKPKLIQYTTFRRSLFRARSRWSHFSLLIYLPVIILIFACLLASCETGRQTIALDEAKEISLQFSDTSFVPPPRSINDVVPKIDEYFSKARDCVSNPLISLKEISERLRDAPPYPDRMCKVRVMEREAWRELSRGRYSRSIQLYNMSLKALPKNNNVAHGNHYAILARFYAYAGDFKSANRAFKKALSWYARSKYHDARKEYILNNAKAHIEQLKGNLYRAEQYFRIARRVSKTGSKPQEWLQVDLIDNLILQGRLQEAEALSRELLHDYMQYTFRPSLQARELSVLSKVLFKQCRYSEAEYVAKCAINKYIIHGTDCSSIFLNLSTQVLAKSLAAQERWEEAIEQFEAIRDVMIDLDLFEIRFSGDPDWAIALLATGQIAKALEQLEKGFAYASEQFGQDHYRTAIIRGLIAVAHAANDDKRAALKGFAEAVPILLKTFRKAGSEAFTRFTKDPHLILIIETYMNLLADIRDTPLEKTMEIDAVNVSFSLADFLRAHSVQRVVASAGARYAVKDPELADIVRREQDARKHLDVLYATLANAVAQERTDQNLEVIESLKEKIGKLSKARLAFIKEIELRFPQYAQLINPVPPSLKDARASLNPGESLLSIYIGRDQSFVWAVPYEGKVMFATAPLSKKEVDTMVAQIRATLEPNAKKLGDIPQFDLETAYALFKAFFEPVREAWKNSKSLLVVPHGALSYLPLSLLPTEKIKLPDDKDVLFENYKQVPWLVRSHSVTVLPSVSTLILLRTTPQRDLAQLPFVGFGDPYFNEQQAQAAAKTKKALQIASSKQPDDFALRGLTIKRVETDQLDSAQINILPRLPETAEEIRSMALVMNADPVRDVFIGAQANEQQVKTMDLSGYKVIAFATHGLAPGDLDGLLQPALALSSPKVAGIDGDGLLAMDEIFGLRLNADWIVLSACNTGAGKEEGAEALSGLCRAFFYAGTRSLLVTNWPVETNSAKTLTTDLFKGMAQNPLLTRAEALRQSKLSLIDGFGHIDPESGKLLFSYAHPIFWAAFSLVGG